MKRVILSKWFSIFSPAAALLALAVIAPLALSGCSASQDAERAEAVIAAVVSIAQAEEPALPPADAAILTPWANLGSTLDAQLKTCISSAASSGGKKSAFLACFNTFSQGLLNASELAQLRVLSPASQAKVQLIVTAISTGLNIVIAALGGTAQPAPTVAERQPSRQELEAFAAQAGLDRTFTAVAGF